MTDQYKSRGRNDTGKSAKTTPSAKGKAPSTARYDLGVPGLVATCIEDLYRSTGTRAAPADRLFPVAVVVGVVLGLVLGYHPSGRLYGPIGAVLGAVFGLIGGISAGANCHWFLGPWLRPETKALQLIRTGRIRSASKVFRRARWWILFGRSGLSRLAGLAMHSLGLGRADLPPDIASANLEACQGILAESVGDMQSAADAYRNALTQWPRHGFVLISLLDLVIREQMWELEDEVKTLTETFIEKARDKTLERAAKEYLALMKPLPKPPDEPPLHRIKEEGPEYRRGDREHLPLTCKLIENPGSQISNGVVVIKGGKSEKNIKLPPMPFQLMMQLAEAMCGDRSGEPEQMGWVSINDLLATLPWTTPNVTNSNVHKLVYKLRNTLEQHDMDRAFIEENLNGCYRISLPPERIQIERVVAA